MQEYYGDRDEPPNFIVQRILKRLPATKIFNLTAELCVTP